MARPCMKAIGKGGKEGPETQLHSQGLCPGLPQVNRRDIFTWSTKAGRLPSFNLLTGGVISIFSLFVLMNNNSLEQGPSCQNQACPALEDSTFHIPRSSPWVYVPAPLLP